MKNEKNLKELLRELQLLTVSELIEKIKSGEASPAHLAVARGILNDNNISSVPTGDTSELFKLLNSANALPFSDEEVRA